MVFVQSRFFKSQLSYLSIPSFSLTWWWWLTGVLFLTFDIDRSISTILYQHPRTSHIEDWLLPFKQSIYLIFTLIGRYQQFIINIRELNILNNDYLLCSFLFTSQSSHLEWWGSHFSLPKVLILNPYTQNEGHSEERNKNTKIGQIRVLYSLFLEWGLMGY